MSPRCNVVIRYNDTALLFYRHIDGYPQKIIPILHKFLSTPNLRNNDIQSSGWLIVIGREEMLEDHKALESKYGPADYDYRGKVGYFELTCSIQPDIDYIYIVDMVNSTISAYNADPDIDSWQEYLKLRKIEVSSK